MDIKFRTIRGVFILAITLFIALVPFSFLVGWNLITLLLFWFILIPMISIYLPTKILKKEDWLIQALGGLVLFYGVMVFLIYRQYQTDYFKIMIWSAVANLVVVAGFFLAKKPQPKSRLNHWMYFWRYSFIWVFKACASCLARSAKSTFDEA